jgi:hypothetical protein
MFDIDVGNPSTERFGLIYEWALWSKLPFSNVLCRRTLWHVTCLYVGQSLDETSSTSESLE